MNLTNSPGNYTQLCTIALLQKKQKYYPVIASKKSVKVSFVTSGIEKMRKKVDDFLFLPLLNFRSSFKDNILCYKISCYQHERTQQQTKYIH